MLLPMRNQLSGGHADALLVSDSCRSLHCFDWLEIAVKPLPEDRDEDCSSHMRKQTRTMPSSDLLVDALWVRSVSRLLLVSMEDLIL